jgi:two-component system OmpR family sensor kinase/two-component system sensor histidine kinase BaeS
VNRLSVRLTVAIVAVTLLAVGLLAVIVNRAAGTQFRQYLMMGPASGAEELALQLGTFYGQTGSWDGVATVVDSNAMGQGTGAAGRGRMMGRGAVANAVVADAAGHVVYDPMGMVAGGTLSRSQRAGALPIATSGDPVGYLLLMPPGRVQLQGPEQAFLDAFNQALLLAALVALLAGALVGFLVARTLAAPMDHLAGAAQAIAGGDLSQRVLEEGTLETQAVARSFNQMAENLQQAEQLRRNLVADVAHELRTPLTVIQGNLQALLDGVYPLERAEIVTIYDETRLLSRLVADLRELAQAEAGQLQLALQPTDLGGVLRQTVDSFMPFAEARGADLGLHLPPSLPPVQADPDRLGQVMRNLVSNALRHVPAGGRVAIEARREGPQVLVSVQDDGPGIPPEQLERVFDRFYRGDAGRSRDSGGSGLGLAITRYLVEAQGGRIGVESQPGQGTRFWFTLAVAKETAGA